MSEQVEQSSPGTQLNTETQKKTDSITFPTKASEDPQVAAERTAFKTYVESSGEQVPDNFKDADSWFSSLKEAQANYTKGQQEIAELRKQYSENLGNPTPETEDSTANTQTPEPEILVTEDSPELRIQSPQTETESPETDLTSTPSVSQESYEAWGMEMAATGSLSSDTRNEIKNSTGFTEEMIDDFVIAQKARYRENFAKAAGVVGGQDRLSKIFEWASTSLSEKEQHTVNIGLASPSYEVTLRGLSSMYDQAVTSQKAAEPAPNPNLTTRPAGESGLLPFSTRREFMAQRSDPKFNFEPKFRGEVEARMSITDWNNLPA
jgi:hypothetical protein